MDEYYIRELKNIITVNSEIIKGLQVQKARIDQLLDKYQEEVNEELTLPSNKFMDLTKKVSPFVDAVISSKVSDYELLKRYESYNSELVTFAKRTTGLYTELYQMQGLIENLLQVIQVLKRNSIEKNELIHSLSGKPTTKQAEYIQKKGNAAKWTDVEDKWLIKFYKEEGIDQSALRLNRPKGAVLKRAKQLGLNLKYPSIDKEVSTEETQVDQKTP